MIQVIDTQPFQCLGATCILENIGVGLGSVIKPLFSRLDFFRPKTTRFLMLHLHEDVQHGDQVLDAIQTSGLDIDDMAELTHGARASAVLYLRMLDWHFGADPLSNLFRL